MLVLSRKLNESIQIGENITVTVLKRKGNRVSLGIEAPKSVEVTRKELLFWDEVPRTTETDLRELVSS